MGKTLPIYPKELPVCEHRSDILTALQHHAAIIVCGDTGCGKTTQLPKMAFEFWIGQKDKGHRRIACTQPRRLAAVTMAERVASELDCEIGGLVGFRHRFDRKISSDTRIEFMTDGVLLAETRFDPLLRAYNTIIVDEAHERSLNIDFLLGILKRILLRRNDLKVIISSATLDAARFATFFDNAPVISVPGRLFPIEIAYRPPSEGEERDLPRDVVGAVAELPPEGDILVFLPGEHDIRETADCLNAQSAGHDDIIPLLASLPASEQRRAFQTSPRRRIILATNVAETSVTIPGIRAVIDSGVARLSRYIHRTQIQRLQIEPISQASARQRAGRCGRLGPGICLRLYSEEDFLSRDAYTPPEVLRSSLAGVILTMLDLKLGDIEQFPFLDPPKPTMIREGLRELLELGAICHDAGKGIALTDIGRKLAKIPVEPRLARMLLAASDNAVLPSVLPLVAAMACDDPKRRPIDERNRADQAHARFRAANSDFLGTLKLWEWWESSTRELSQSKIRKLCKETYLSYPKMREWRDLVRQLESLAKHLGLSFAKCPSMKEEDFHAALHRSLLAGLLGHIGKYDEEARDYRGAHGLRFALHPSSTLAKATKGKPPWIVAGELVDTSRLFARHAAVIDVRWLESVAGDICKSSYHTPEWDAHFGFVRATEQVTLYGLVIVPARRCDYSRIDPAKSRDIFIRQGLIAGEFPHPPPALRVNLQLLSALRQCAERNRRPDIFDEDRLAAHFDRILPPDICSANALRKWLHAAPAEETAPFVLKKSDWWPETSISDRDFPDTLRIAGVKLSLTYRHSPENPDDDGITCTVRRSDAAVLRLWHADWLVPGLLPEKVAWMLGTLPSALRHVLAPLNETTSILLSMLRPGSETLENAIRTAVNQRWGIRIPQNCWKWEKLPPHLKMRFCIRDDKTGRILALSRNLEDVLSATGIDVSQNVNGKGQGEICTTWAFGTIPTKSVDKNAGWETVSHPALHDEGSGVALKLFTHPMKASEAHASGVTRLFLLALAKTMQIPFRRNRISFDAALYLKNTGYSDDQIASDLLSGAIRETLVRNRPEVRTAEEFERRLQEDRSVLIRTQAEMSDILVDAATSAAKILRLTEDERIPVETAASISTQLGWLLYRGFPCTVPLATLRHYKRYLKGAVIRLERARRSPSADLKKEAQFAPYWQRYREAIGDTTSYDVGALNEFRWMLEEYRISLFAQELHTPEPVSPKRLDAKWARVALAR